jgi:hypothetical protein
MLFVAAGGVYLLARPRLEARRASSEIARYARAERQFSDADTGVSLSLPEGWVLLRDDSPFILSPTAVARLAHPGLQAFGTLHAETLTRPLPSPAEHLERVIADRRLVWPSLVASSPSDTTVNDLPAKAASLAWDQEGKSMRGMSLAWRDGWRSYALSAWGPAASEARLAKATDALKAAVRVSGEPTRQVSAATEALLSEAPELSRESAERLVADRLGSGRSAETLGQLALREVNRGISVLSPEDRRELGTLYEQVYAPIPQKDRARLAAWLSAMRSGMALPAEEAQLMRALLRNGVMSLPEDARQRLQALNAKAVAFALSRP